MKLKFRRCHIVERQKRQFHVVAYANEQRQHQQHFNPNSASEWQHQLQQQHYAAAQEDSRPTVLDHFLSAKQPTK